MLRPPMTPLCSHPLRSGRSRNRRNNLLAHNCLVKTSKYSEEEYQEVMTSFSQGGNMKTIALIALMAIGLVAASGCYWHHHRYNDRDSYYSH